ncbi:hypothetical protein V5N11_003487 [Cardamine amara subsp. amara]|uniref:Uncharacterized protein n=1 Tax=Cardamine amara subsp. amara TaxID=228776 RepID=A0ABD1C2I7_CARAN
MSNEGDKSDNSNSAGASRRPSLELQAIMREMRRMPRTELGAVPERIDKLQESVQGQTEAPPTLITRENVVRGRRQQHRQEKDEEVEDYYSGGSRVSNRTHRRPRRDREARDRNEDNINGLKLNIPQFHGKSDPDAYLEWEKKIELVFDCQTYSEHKKVQLAATEFYDYAIN